LALIGIVCRSLFASVLSCRQHGLGVGVQSNPIQFQGVADSRTVI
jgi:hypothetical protein